jgi:hypothetical protein
MAFGKVTVPATAFQSFPLPSGFPTPSGIGPFTSAAITVETFALAPLAAFNAAVVSFDSLPSGIATSSTPFPFPLPIGGI